MPTKRQRNANETPLKKNVKNTKKVKNEKSVFIPPTLEEITNYCIDRQNGVDAKRFHDSYQVAGWVDSNGKPIINWKQKMIQVWERKEQPKGVNKEREQTFAEITRRDVANRPKVEYDDDEIL